MKRKLFSLAMIVCLVLTLIPTAAFAADTIAKIGDDVYATLQEAIDAAQDGDVIFLQKDTTEASVTIKDGTMIYLDYQLMANINLLEKLVTAAGEKVYSIVTHENNTIFAYGTKGIENAAKFFDDRSNQKHTVVNINCEVPEDTTLTLPVETGVNVANDNIDICATIESRNGSVCVFSKEKIEETAKQLAEENPDEDIKVTVVKAEADTELTLPEGVEVKVQYGAIENSGSGSGSVIINGAPVGSGGSHTVPVAPPSTAVSKSSGSGIKVKYEGGNSFSTSKSAVPTSVEIDGVAVPFTGNGNNFTVSGIPAGAKWITVRWNSTSVTTNFTPNGAYFAEVEIPKTGDMPIWAAIAAVFGF